MQAAGRQKQSKATSFIRTHLENWTAKLFLSRKQRDKWKLVGTGRKGRGGGEAGDGRAEMMTTALKPKSTVTS